MEANLCLATRHFPAMRHHKTVLVPSSVRLPALQAKVGPHPGAAQVAVVGAGVVLSCALGTMYWKRARPLQLPMHCSSPTSHGGGNGGASDHLANGIVQPKDLHDLLSEICIRKLETKPPKLIELIHQCLAQKDLNPDLMTSLLEGKLPENIGEHEYNLGIVLILALISEKKYDEAKKIHEQLPEQSDLDGTLGLLLAIINIMMTMESMLQFPNETSTDDLKEKLKQVEEAWEKYKRKGNADIPIAGPPDTT